MTILQHFDESLESASPNVVLRSPNLLEDGLKVTEHPNILKKSGSEEGNKIDVHDLKVTSDSYFQSSDPLTADSTSIVSIQLMPIDTGKSRDEKTLNDLEKRFEKFCLEKLKVVNDNEEMSEQQPSSPLKTHSPSPILSAPMLPNLIVQPLIQKWMPGSHLAVSESLLCISFFRVVVCINRFSLNSKQYSGTFQLLLALFFLLNFCQNLVFYLFILGANPPMYIVGGELQLGAHPGNRVPTVD